MSRIGRAPIPLPDGVSVQVENGSVLVKGKGGELSHRLPSAITVELENGTMHVRRGSDEPAQRAMHGLTRSLLYNMVTGVSTGFSRALDLVGTGYRAQQDGKNLTLQLGFSHPVTVEPMADNTLQAESQTRIVVRGVDKHAVGEQAARIRKLRKPNPYTGKGIRYEGEQVRQKAGKSAAKGG